MIIAKCAKCSRLIPYSEKSCQEAVRCTKCLSSSVIFNQTVFDQLEAYRRYPGRLIIVVSIVISLAAGLSSGIMYGHFVSKKAMTEKFDASLATNDALNEELVKSQNELASSRNKLTKSGMDFQVLLQQNAQLKTDVDKSILTEAELFAEKRKVESLKGDLTAKQRRIEVIQADIATFEEENRKRAEIQEKAKRAGASEAAHLKLDEYWLDSSWQERYYVSLAIDIFTKIIAAHEKKINIKIGDIPISDRVRKECGNITRLAGDILPKGDEFTLAEHWQAFLDSK